MPTTSVSIDWGILSFAGLEAASDTRDGLALSSGLIAMYESLLGKGNKKWTHGARKVASVQMLTHTGITSFSDGFEEFDGGATEPTRDAIYSPALSGLLLKIGAKEMAMYGNSTAGLRPKVESLVVNGMGMLSRNWTQRIVAGIGSGFTDWLSWNGFDSVTGVFERAAAGSQSNSIGGLSKSTYAGAIGWSNRVVNMNNAYGSNQNALFQLVTATRRHKDSGKKAWLFSDQGMANQKRAVQANERYYTKDSLDSGKPVEMYHGFKIFQEPQMPVSTATGGATTNTYPITAYLVDTEDIFPSWMKAVKMAGADEEIPDGNFGTGQWRKIQGQQMVYGCPMWVAGQMIVLDMGSSGVAYGGETY